MKRNKRTPSKIKYVQKQLLKLTGSQPINSKVINAASSAGVSGQMAHVFTLQQLDKSSLA
jgi:hypothetical protein